VKEQRKEKLRKDYGKNINMMASSHSRFGAEKTEKGKGRRNSRESNKVHPCSRQASYQLSYLGEHDKVCFINYQLIVKKFENKLCITKKLFIVKT
jgi:hypothetical protein